jgi:hypothetical protein
MDLISASCPKCAATLRIPPGQGTVSCEYCGNTFLLADAPRTSIVDEGRPFRIENAPDRTTIVFPEDRKGARLLLRLGIACLLFCIPFIALFADEPQRWAGAFGGVIVMVPLAIACLIVSRSKNNTRRELHLTQNTLELLRLFAGEVRAQTILEATTYQGCEMVKQRGGEGGPRYLVRIRGEGPDILLGEKHALDLDDASLLKNTVEHYFRK